MIIYSCLIFTAHAQNTVKELLITTESAFPKNFSDDNGKTISGSSSDKVHELLKRSQIPYQMKIMSWNRAFELARNQDNTCVFSTVRNAERESGFKWVGPIDTNTKAVFGSPDKFGKITKIDDIKNGKIGGYLGDEFVSYLAAQGGYAIVSYEPAIAFKNLAMGRLEYVAVGAEFGEYFIANNHLTDKVKLLFTFGSTDLYLACNPKLDDSLINLMNLKLAEMVKDGTYKKIDSKYRH